MAHMVKNPPAMWETRVRSLSQEDPLKKEMATHSSILPWRIPWTEEPCGNSHRVGHDWAIHFQFHLILLCSTLLYLADMAFFLQIERLCQSCVQQHLLHLVSLCPNLVILEVLKNFSLLLYCFWWSVYQWSSIVIVLGHHKPHPYKKST